ncbi:hypothetical protein BDW22DRAFT_1421202 [Trametopsis cervina]|nr:hypothetical protein BDW22DRAFT_1421202 [Trametopsis cervina]
MSHYCETCDRWFTKFSGLQQHLNTSVQHRVYSCDDCDEEFSTEDDLTDHYIESDEHAYCWHCDEHFDYDEDLTSHYESEHYYCADCEKVFGSAQGLDDHERAVHEVQWYCDSCDRVFNTEHGLNMHLNTSATHNPRTRQCPGKRCNKSFVSHADLLLHLESGACRSGMTRQHVNTLAVRYDRDNVITDPSHLLGYYDEPEVVETWATVEAWNGYAYECYLCHKTFRALSALNNHLGSPAHADKIYRCPEQFNGCDTHFKTLSALLHHVERSECGVTRFRKRMAGGLDDIMQGMRRLTAG